MSQQPQSAVGESATGDTDFGMRRRMPIDIGWVLVGRFDEAEMEAVRLARDETYNVLQETFPEFEWKLSLSVHAQFEQGLREEPTRLLDFGVTERDIQSWDFAVVITAADLVAHKKPFTLAVFSTALGLAVISTSRIDPASPDQPTSEAGRVRTMTTRIRSLALHSLGHLAGLEHEEGQTNWMQDFQGVSELDQSLELSPDQKGEVLEALRAVADLRLEEKSELARAWRLRFYLQSLWTNHSEILQSIIRAEFWMFPIRLSRLATAAISALVVLLITAEAWELGMNLSLTTTVWFAAASLAGTSFYVIQRQRLLVRRERVGQREQKVIANISVIFIVAGGMLTTQFLLFLLGLCICLIVVPDTVVESWSSLEGAIGFDRYACLSLYVASLGLVIGALGASFENQEYFRHVTFIDEEI